MPCSRFPSAPLVAGLVSGLAHALGLAVCAAWVLEMPDQPARFAGARSVTAIQLTATPPRSEPETTAVTIEPAEPPVIIEPRRAELEGSVLVEVPANKVTTEVTIERVLSDPEFATIAASPPPALRKLREEGAPQHAPARATPPRAARHKPPVTSVSVRASDLPPAPAARPIEASTLGTDATLPPSFAGNSPPRYPEQARQNGWQGTVHLRLNVGIDGRVRAVEIVRTSGYELLDAEAVRAVQAWRGAPARRGGRPIETIEVLPVTFRLRG